MVERNIKELLLSEIEKNGENPQQVTCEYFSPSLVGGSTVKWSQQCSADNLPEGDLLGLVAWSDEYTYTLRSDKGYKIETEPRQS